MKLDVKILLVKIGIVDLFLKFKLKIVLIMWYDDILLGFFLLIKIILY